MDFHPFSPPHSFFLSLSFLPLSLWYFTSLCTTHFLRKPALFLHSSFRKGQHLEKRKLQIMNKELTGRLKTQKEWTDQAPEIAFDTKLISKFLPCSSDSSSRPLCRNRIAPAINTLRAMGAGEKIGKSNSQLFFNHIAKDDFKAVSQILQNIPKRPGSTCSTGCHPRPFLFLVLQPAQGGWNATLCVKEHKTPRFNGQKRALSSSKSRRTPWLVVGVPDTTSRMQPLRKDYWLLILLHNSKERCYPEPEYTKSLRVWRSPHYICQMPSIVARWNCGHPPPWKPDLLAHI